MKLKVVLTDNQWKRISDISNNLGLLIAASVVLPYILEKPNLLAAILGIVVSLTLWYISIVTAKKY